ncbi:MAG: hypothetical protein ABSC92_05865 [Rhizomicrobium sp.]
MSAISLDCRKMHRHKIATALSSFVLLAGSIITLSACQARAPTYFPDTEFRDLDSWDIDEPKAWSELLSDFREPAIWDTNNNGFTIRVTVAPPASYFMVVRISENPDGSITAQSKQLPPRAKLPLIITPFDVSGSELDDLKKTLADEHFWALTNHHNGVTSDGVEMLLEVNDHGRYHVVHSAAFEQPPMLHITRLLLNLAHLHLPGE